MTYKVKCHKCDCRHFRLEVVPYSFGKFAVCMECHNVFLFSHDNEFPTFDDKYIKHKAILFRRFK